MSARNDGGPAFPAPLETALMAGLKPSNGALGMTLRDYFAANAPITVADAMVAVAADSASIGTLQKSARARVMAMLAEMRLEYADAMLAAREAA